MNSNLYWIAIAIVTVLASARLTRLAVYDDFPPVRWVREKYLDATDGSNWQLLGLCGYCASFWMTALVVLFGYLSGVYGTDPFGGGSDLDFKIWWFLFGTLAASYLAATYIANDGDTTENTDAESEDI